MTLAETLAAFVSELRGRPLPEHAQREAVRAVLDWLGSAVRGGEAIPARAIDAVVAQRMAGDDATVLATGARVSALGAALANGAASHALELDDLHQASTFHPAAPIVSAALAAAEQADANGERFLQAIIAGYEVGIRVAEAASPSHYRFWHPTATCGVFGAAVAAGCVLGLSSRELADALGSAGTLASGLWQFLDDGAMSKPLHAGKAAHDGLLAAELARAGLTGAHTILEGRRGFFAATTEDADLSRITEGLGLRLKILENGYKRHACCGHTHAAVDAALLLRDRLAGRPVERVEVDTYRVALEITDNPAPQSENAAKFSLQHAIAVALVDGAAGLEQFRSPRLDDPTVVGLRSRVMVREAPELSAVYPIEWPARVRLLLADGASIEETVSVPRGMPGNPMSDAELRQKFEMLVAPVIGVDGAERLAGAVDRLSAGLPVRELVRCCVSAVTEVSGERERSRRPSPA
jgi:2-methylcitrate dehydratase PrpD